MPSLPSALPSPSPSQDPSVSTGARQRTLTDFFSATMAVTPSPNSNNTNNDTNNTMETEEESRKRSRESTPENIRAPGDGSLLTNTSIRPRISSDIPDDVNTTPGATSTPNRIALQMQNIRQNARAAILPRIDSDDDSMQFNDSSTHSNIRRVRDVMNGVVNLANTVGNVNPDHLSMHWDNNDLNLSQNLQLVSPPPRPVFINPPPPDTPQPTNNQVDSNEDHPSAAPPVNIADILKKTLEESLETSIKAAISEFEEKHLGTLNSLQEKINQQAAISDALATKIQAVGIETTRNINAIHEANVEIESITRSKNELAMEVANINGNVNRIDSGVQETRNSIQAQNEILRALQDRVAALESQLASTTNHPTTNPVPQPQDALSSEEVTRVRNRMRQEDDRYFMSTISIKNFWLPNRFNHSRQRASASIILKSLGVEDILGQVNNVYFSSDCKTLRLTFNSPRDCLEGMATMSSSAAQLRRNNTPMPFTFHQLTPPRFNSQRENLYRIASGMKRNGRIDRFIFLIVNGQLVIKASKRGARDWLIYDNANNRPGEQQHRPNNDTHNPAQNEPQSMEVDPAADQRCSICLISLDQGHLSYLHCRHVFHTACVKVSMEKNVECPQCKQTKPEVEELIKCKRCVEYMESGEILEYPQTTLSRKCSHTHLAECMIEYIAPHLNDFPYTPDTLQALISNPDIHGCFSCSVGEDLPNNERDFLTEVKHFPGMRSYISLADMLRIESMRSRAIPVAATPEVNATNMN